MFLIAKISETEGEGEGDPIVLPPGQAYNFDTEDLFGNEYLDVVLEQIEKELGRSRVPSCLLCVS